MPEASRIIEQVAGIQETVEGLTGLTADLTKRQAAQIHRMQRMVRLTGLGLILSLLLIVGGAFLLARTIDTANRVERNNQYIRVLQDKTSAEVLCPLWDLFLDSYNPNGPSAQADPAKYEEAFAVLEQGAFLLGCSHVTRGRD